MFLVNGEPLHEKTHPTEYAWMKKKFKEIRDSGKEFFNFSAFNKRVQLLREDGRLIPQKQRRRLISMTGSTTEPTGVHQTWSYASGMSALNPDGSGNYTLKRGTMAMDYDTAYSVERDIELIFFLLHLSNNKKIKHVDYAAKRKAEASMIALRSKAESLVYSIDSPIHPENIGTEQPLRNIGLAWGITNALSLDIYSLMGELWNSIQVSQQNYHRTERGYSEFIEEVYKYGDTGKRAAVILGIERGVLKYDGNIWKMVTRGGAEQFLCGVPVQDEANKDEYVMKYVLDVNYIYEALEAALREPSVTEEPVVDTTTKVQAKGLKRNELLNKAKDLGWVGTHYKELMKMKKDELEDLVRDKRKPKPATAKT